MSDDEYVVDGDVVYEEEKLPHVIETGDSVKVKQVLDDATMVAITDAGYEPDYRWENFKFLLMFLSCVCAMAAQFAPIPFPESRPLLAVCCGGYFAISSVLQIIVSFVDKDMILYTKPQKQGGFEHAMCVRTDFPRFQEHFSLTVEFKNKPTGVSIDLRRTVGKMYVGKYFTAVGEFDEDAFVADVQKHVQRFVDGKYGEVTYNHKLN